MRPTLIPLQLKHVRVRSLRCHGRYELACAPGINLIVGENGCGKTTLLEAISLMACGRSFRQAKDANLVQTGKKSFHICGQWRRFGPLQVDVQSQGRATHVHLQGRLVRRRSDLMEVLPVIIEAPQGRNLIAGPPSERRRWLDHTLVAVHEGHLQLYRHYFRAVMQRNRLLRGAITPTQIEAWEAQIVRYGLRIMHLREDLLDRLNAYLLMHEEMAEAKLKLRMQTTAPASADAWLARLRQQRRTHGLRLGPHCDRLIIAVGKDDVRSNGSHGQQRLAAIALRLAEWSLKSRLRGVAPVLLLDDAMEALDAQRRARLLARLQECGAQVFITAPAVARTTADMHVHTVSAATKTSVGGTMSNAGETLEAAA